MSVSSDTTGQAEEQGGKENCLLGSTILELPPRSSLPSRLLLS